MGVIWDITRKQNKSNYPILVFNFFYTDSKWLGLEFQYKQLYYAPKLEQKI